MTAPRPSDRNHVADYTAAGPLLAWPELTAVVVMTADYLTDVRALLGTAGLRFAFVGLMGGRRKIARIFAQLREEGVPQEVLDKVHAPVGLDIAATRRTRSPSASPRRSCVTKPGLTRCRRARALSSTTGRWRPRLRPAFWCWTFCATASA